MLRDYIINSATPADATAVASAECSTGMAVTKTYSADGATFAPAGADATNIFFVQKARIPTGIKASMTDFSDWDEDFNKVAVGERVTLLSYCAGEQFGTDQHTLTESDIGKAVTFNDGKAVKSELATGYILVGLVHEGTHVLAHIEKV